MIFSIQASTVTDININPENSNFLLTVHKHCEKTIKLKHTLYAEHISCFSILFSWAKNSNKTKKQYNDDDV